MYWLKKKKHRMMAAVLLTAFLAFGTAAGGTKEPPGAALAWWGTIYPDFCFGSRTGGGEGRIKTSFWIGEVLSRLCQWCASPGE